MLIPARHIWIHDFVILAYFWSHTCPHGGKYNFGESQANFSPVRRSTAIDVLFLLYPLSIYGRQDIYFGPWENAEKELTLAGGALVIAGFIQKRRRIPLQVFEEANPFRAYSLALTMILYGIGHFLYAKEVADYVPSWVPGRLFWAYFAGIALIVQALRSFLDSRFG
jgi:hypothetical protein